jgi:hypothetical protein
MNQQCKCCGKSEDTRMGFCWDCVECESVIYSGEDMYDNAPPKLEGMSQAMSTLKYILSKYQLVNYKNK